MDWLRNSLNGLQHLAQSSEIILCPNFIVLADAVKIVGSNNINIGAQNCSAYHSGSYTGDVDAQSLYNVGATFCIVGHSEQRQHCPIANTNNQLAEKLHLLVQQNIEPLFCIGEAIESEPDTTKKYLLEQLEPLLTVAREFPRNYSLAYEPVWAIGSKKRASAQHITEIITFLREVCTQQVPNAQISFLYGGSISPENISELKKLALLDGFLIGNASLEFETLQKIITAS